MESASEMKRLDEKVKDVWALVFKMPADTAGIWRENEQLSTLQLEREIYAPLRQESCRKEEKNHCRELS